MSEHLYRTPTPDDVGKSVEVSDSQSFGAREQNRLDDIRDGEWKVNGLWWPYARIRVYTDSEVNAAIAATIPERLDLYRKQLGVGTPAAFAVETIMSKATKERWVTGDQLDAANARVAELEQTFSLMAMLRGDDWCVVLKCLPASMNWIIEGGRSEYDTQSPDIKLGEGKWCCELSCMRMMKGDGMSGYRVPVWTLHESPYEAVRLAYERATVTQ